MPRPENLDAEPTTHPKSLGKKLGGLVFRFWHGHTRETAELYKYWRDIERLREIDGKLFDQDWIQNRQKDLITQFANAPRDMDTSPEVYLWAYARARLEDYCRHQGQLPDGRTIVGLPVYGLENKEELARLGIEVDNFERENIQPNSGHTYTAILPTGWTFRPSDLYAEQGPLGTPNNERWAAVYDEAGTAVVGVFYGNKPFPFEDSFTSRGYTYAPS